MTRWYLESSAALKLIITEDESDALTELIRTTRPDLISSWLLETEMRRIAGRQGDVGQQLVTEILDEIDLVAMPGALFREAGLLPGTHLRSLDALHLAAAVSIGVDAIVTYDERMAASARDLGLHVLSPS